MVFKIEDPQTTLWLGSKKKAALRKMNHAPPHRWRKSDQFPQNKGVSSKGVVPFSALITG